MTALLTDKKVVAVTDFASSYAANADLGVILSYVTKKHPELSKKLPKLSQLYRTYMFLIGTGLFGNISVPSEDVDKIWHAHILHTVLYAEFCENVAGRFIHHNPFGDEVGDSERNASVLKLVSASETTFGTNVFDAKQGWCGSCAGCKACAGDCGGAVCGGAGEDFSASTTLRQETSISLAQNISTQGSDCSSCVQCANAAYDS